MAVPESKEMVEEIFKRLDTETSERAKNSSGRRRKMAYSELARSYFNEIKPENEKSVRCLKEKEEAVADTLPHYEKIANEYCTDIHNSGKRMGNIVLGSMYAAPLAGIGLAKLGATLGPLGAAGGALVGTLGTMGLGIYGAMTLEKSYTKVYKQSEKKVVDLAAKRFEEIDRKYREVPLK